MFKCTGVCSTCGRCKGFEINDETEERKRKLLKYPSDFMPEKNREGYGVAFDIGTTTVVGMLWDLERGINVGSYALTNPQSKFGMDVITRITFCNQEDGNLEILRTRIINCIEEINTVLCEKEGISKENIKKIVVCGNTTMSHIFAGYSPQTLAESPFLPAYTGRLELSSKEADITMSTEGSITVLPNIAGHVGGDITAGLIASRALNEKGLTVFIDIGTNGEIVLVDKKNVYACSSAAGPAFEGASIMQGMRAVKGSIERVRITKDGEVQFKTIGGCEPQGICGSALIDAIAQMINAGLISKTGRIISTKDFEKKNLPRLLEERIVEVDGERRFILVSKELGEDIVITQKDVREVQLAKGAIAAAISLMLREAKKSVNDIDKIIVAGAFGNYIDKESAVTIGILPQINIDKIISAGNTAGAGVSMTLMSWDEMNLADKIVLGIKHIDLASREEFQREYLKSMSFR